jgi:hypothetical protein
LLRAFQDDEALSRMDREAEARGYRTHEFGDSVLLTRRARKPELSCPSSGRPEGEASTSFELESRTRTSHRTA